MTIDEFAKKNKKSKKTVIGWISKNLVPGANLEKNYVPNSARKPYTGARAKTCKAIYSSIIRGTNKRQHVSAILYGICEDEFNGYINRLVKAGLIEVIVLDGITYYDLTLKGIESKCNERFIIKAIEAVSSGLTHGVTKTLIDL